MLQRNTEQGLQLGMQVRMEGQHERRKWEDCGAKGAVCVGKGKLFTHLTLSITQTHTQADTFKLN